MRIPILSRLRGRRAPVNPYLNDPALRARLLAAIQTALATRPVEVDVVTDPADPYTTETVFLTWRQTGDLLLRLTRYDDGHLDWGILIGPDGPSLFTESDDVLVQWLPAGVFAKPSQFLDLVETLMSDAGVEVSR